MRGFVIAGTNSGCGKTTTAMGLMALLKSKGHPIAPFKAGPDYIDPLFHRKILGKPSYNLDSYMLSKSAITYLFKKHTTNNSIAIVEGVMGMYDGMGVEAFGSTYELSQKLNLPVILVVNCKGLYQSVAAIVKGFAGLKDDAGVKGVIFNHCPSAGYYNFLKSLVEKECQVSCVGYIPSNKSFALESRHLGLVQAEEVEGFTEKVQELVNILKETIDIDKLLEINHLRSLPEVQFELPNINLSGLHIGVAYDKAFRFYYQDNLELLQELGAQLHFFSPLKDKVLPEQANCLYLGGGYPEVFAKELSGNQTLLDQIKTKAQKGMPIYAECGGLMYLAHSIIDLEEGKHKMAGVFNASVQMTRRLQKFGYANLTYQGYSTKCHEFHRSKVVVSDKACNYSVKYQLSKPDRDLEWTCGLQYNNSLAGYAHVHFYSNFQFLKQIVQLWKKAII
ncbi:cobyrinate a,c-diamide synthase [Labilibacter sediminis]|nr:cobyrinate a,c-diamide synthase [Labilibacter sediminis]